MALVRSLRARPRLLINYIIIITILLLFLLLKRRRLNVTHLQDLDGTRSANNGARRLDLLQVLFLLSDSDFCNLCRLSVAQRVVLQPR